MVAIMGLLPTLCASPRDLVAGYLPFKQFDSEKPKVFCVESEALELGRYVQCDLSGHYFRSQVPAFLFLIGG